MSLSALKLSVSKQRKKAGNCDSRSDDSGDRVCDRHEIEAKNECWDYSFIQ